MKQVATWIGIWAILIFSIGSILVVLSGDIPPLQISAMSMISGAISIYLFFKVKGESIRPHLRVSASLYLLMFLGIGGYQILFNFALKTAPAFEINVLNYMWPIFLVLFIKLISRDKFKSNELFGTVVGFVGTILIFMPTEQGQHFQMITISHVAVIIGALFWALYSAYARGQDYSIALMIPILFISGVFALVFHLLYEETVINQPIVVWIAAFVFCVTRFCYVLWDVGMKKGDQMLLSSLSYFLPLLSSVYFIIFGFNPARVETAIGAGFIISGCLIVNMHRMSFRNRPRS